MYTIRDDLRKCLQNDVVVPDWSAQKKKSAKNKSCERLSAIGS